MRLSNPTIGWPQLQDEQRIALHSLKTRKTFCMIEAVVTTSVYKDWPPWSPCATVYIFPFLKVKRLLISGRQKEEELLVYRLHQCFPLIWTCPPWSGGRLLIVSLTSILVRDSDRSINLSACLKWSGASWEDLTQTRDRHANTPAPTQVLPAVKD